MFRPKVDAPNISALPHICGRAKMISIRGLHCLLEIDRYLATGLLMSFYRYSTSRLDWFRRIEAAEIHPTDRY